MEQYVAELVGTAILVLLGNSVVANVVLSDTKGHAGGWIVITIGWGMAVFVAVLCVADISGAHLNPAVTVGLATAGKFAWQNVPGFIIAQLLGAMLGSSLVYLFYRDHYLVTKDAGAKLATFGTVPNIRRLSSNVLSELIGTFVLVFAVLMAVDPSIKYAAGGVEGQQALKLGLGALGALPVGLVVFAIGLSLGGTTGYAINPARDLGPRLIHALLPIPGKRDSDWSYAWVPVVGPLVGGLLAALVKRLLFA